MTLWKKTRARFNTNPHGLNPRARSVNADLYRLDPFVCPLGLAGHRLDPCVRLGHQILVPLFIFLPYAGTFRFILLV
jgi:hypothetical protein